MAELLEERDTASWCAGNGQEALSVLHRKPQPTSYSSIWRCGDERLGVRSQQQREATLAAIPTVVLSGEADLAGEAASRTPPTISEAGEPHALFAILSRYCG